MKEFKLVMFSIIKKVPKNNTGTKRRRLGGDKLGKCHATAVYMWCSHLKDLKVFTFVRPNPAEPRVQVVDI